MRSHDPARLAEAPTQLSTQSVDNGHHARVAAGCPISFHSDVNAIHLREHRLFALQTLATLQRCLFRFPENVA
jgi:hypothetical protein